MRGKMRSLLINQEEDEKIDDKPRRGLDDR
jgi:hypothetical protein